MGLIPEAESGNRSFQMETPRTYHAHGKFLLTGEYAILRGAWGLALPLKPGQRMQVSSAPERQTLWISREQDGRPWFHALIHPGTGLVVESDDTETAAMLEKILRAVPDERRRKKMTHKQVEIQAEFDRNWGLGSSSTLIALIAQWMEISPYPLLEASFGGSGYDLACAVADGPLLYRKRNNASPDVQRVALPSELLERMLFVYSGKKVNSRKKIKPFLQNPPPDSFVETISEISLSLAENPEFSFWCDALREHEQIMSDFLKQEPIGMLHPDFYGVVKSMGAWGGDFFMALSNDPGQAKQYFLKKGYKSICSAMEWVLQP